MVSAPLQAGELLPDLNVCAQEPIQFAGAIEPHGVLLVLTTPDLEIVQASDNTLPLLGIATRALLGRRLGHIVGSEDSDRLTTGTFTEGHRRYVAGITTSISQTLFDVLVHRQGELLVVELEPRAIEAEVLNGFAIYESLTDAMSELDGRSGLLNLSQRIASHIRRVTGFDRVMLYRFLEDESGSVIAEDRHPDITPFLGLRFPASDIPAQARRLYLLNTLRLKPDVNAQRVPLLPSINPTTGTALDMSFCILRAMSPVHDEYLRNMGVASSLSISILKEGRLWGLIACHHRQPLLVPPPTRITCEVLARVFSCSIAAAEEEDMRAHASAAREATDRVVARLRQDQDFAGTVRDQGGELQSAMRAGGMAFSLRGRLFLVGLTPKNEHVESLLAWLKSNQQQHLWATAQLVSEYPAAEAFSQDVSGLLSLRIARGAPDFILWFRPSIATVIHWAGNPEKPVEVATGERISPRHSFELWKQTVGDHAAPWNETDQQLARSVRHVFAEALLLQMNAETSRLNLELSRSNIDLDSFAYAASHDLQEPLRAIRSYTQLILGQFGQNLDSKVREFLSVIESNAARMGNLINSLLNYSRLGGTERLQPRPVNAEDALRSALMNLHESARESEATITNDPLPTIAADPVHLVQVFQNLISNAIKYRRVDLKPRIHVSAVLVEGNHWRFSVRDNGQGFDPQYSELIFAAFKRLHGQDVPGNGIGLATCKRIIELNGGSTWAESDGKNCGATFWFTVPPATLEHEFADNLPGGPPQVIRAVRP